MRINKYLAHKGLASRREADRLIEDGKVFINGKPAALGTQVGETDRVEIKGKQKEYVYLAYYKGRGVLTHSPEEHEKDVPTKLKEDYGVEGVFPIGRLDKDSEGLIILTNDGRITGPLLDPEHGHEREYAVLLDKPVSNLLIRHIGTGIDIEGYVTKPARAERSAKNPRRLTIVLTEGKKHQIRRMCAAFGFQVQTLKRTRVANIELGKLKPNQFRFIKGRELHTFRSSLGIV